VKQPKRTLSKSDFKIARDCPTKLFYKKKGYPNSNEENEYMMYLAEGGYLIGKYAQLMYPDGIEVKTDSGTGYAIIETKELLEKNKKITLFEAAVESAEKIIRIDILRKDGNKFDLIEVKSKSWNSVDDDQRRKMQDEYYEDVAFQYYVLKEAFPEAEITPYLLMPDKSKNTGLEGAAGWFKIIREEPDPESTFRNVDVEFLPGTDSPQHRQLIKDNILVLVDVTDEVNVRQTLVKIESEKFLKSLGSPEIMKIQGPLYKECFKCEFRSSDKKKSGYHQCMGLLADPNPHISELYYLGSLRDNYANHLIESKKTSLYDIEPDALLKKDGKMGSRGIRQKLQIDKTRENKEWFSKELKGVLNSWKYPLYLIDFEASICSLPFHIGLHPYETVAFQWSCHIVDNPGSTPRHMEWINTEPRFPNFDFARALMEMVKENGVGTMLMWSKYENTTLRTIYNQMIERNHKDDELQEWLEKVVKMDKDDTGAFIDMNDITLEHYFHPDMQGKTSIKRTLPAIWNNNAYLHSIPWLRKYLLMKDGQVQSPYETLSDDMSDSEKNDAVKEGTAAMRAYYDMLYGRGKSSPTEKEKIKSALLKYCALDTTAMYIIWRHWIEKAA
jgi:hypothetical protein